MVVNVEGFYVTLIKESKLLYSSRKLIKKLVVVIKMAHVSFDCIGAPGITQVCFPM